MRFKTFWNFYCSMTKKWRHEWLHFQLNLHLAIQCRLMRRQRGWSRGELAKRAGISVSSVVRIECMLSDSSLTTLTKIAGAFDVALVARFITHSEAVRTYISEPVIPPPFEQDALLKATEVTR